MTAPKVPKLAQPTSAGTLPATSKTSKEPSRESTKGKEKEVTKDKAPEQTKRPQTTKKASKEKEAAKSKVPEPFSQSVTKVDPPLLLARALSFQLVLVSFFYFEYVLSLPYSGTN